MADRITDIWYLCNSVGFTQTTLNMQVVKILQSWKLVWPDIVTPLSTAGPYFVTEATTVYSMYVWAECTNVIFIIHATKISQISSSQWSLSKTTNRDALCVWTELRTRHRINRIHQSYQECRQVTASSKNYLNILWISYILFCHCMVSCV